MTSSHFELIDQHFAPAEKLNAFAYTNALLNELPAINTPMLHFWTLEDTLILGMKDVRLPHLDRDLVFLNQQHYHYFVRNSGGLAVISDAGVLNLSLFIPAATPLSVDAAYQQMTTLVQQTFPNLAIVAEEVPHSYCPGKFDLAVDGVKIGGMSQRRNPNGIVVMLYLSVNGDQAARAKLVHQFYDYGLAGEPNQWHFPDVEAAAMTTLADCLGTPMTLATVKQMIVRTLSLTLNATAQVPNLHAPAFHDRLQHELAGMQKRQTKLPTTEVN